MTRRSPRSLRALVLGDAMLDTFIDTTPVGISDEAPVPVLDWTATTHALGGMLNVAGCLLAHHAVTVTTIGLAGDDEAGTWMKRACADLGLETHWFDDGRPTIEKARVLADGGNEFFARLDRESIRPVRGEVESEMASCLGEEIVRSSVVVIADYAKGTLTPRLARKAIETGREHGVPVLVDAKPAGLDWYAGASLWTPNQREGREWARRQGWVIHPDDEREIRRLAARLADRNEGPVLLTRASRGMMLALPGTEDIYAISAVPPDVLNTTNGAGDVVLSVMALATCLDIDLRSAMPIAAQVVARAISRNEGTCMLTSEDLFTYLPG